MIILEGPDGAGKTTLLDDLLRRFPELEKGPRASDSIAGPVADLSGYVDTTLAYWLSTPKPACLIYDRFPLISEPIYGPITRDKLPIEFTRKWMASRMRHFKALSLVVFVQPPLKLVREALKVVPGQMVGVAEHINGIWHAYNALAASYSGGNAITYDRTGTGSYDEIILRCYQHIQKWNRV